MLYEPEAAADEARREKSPDWRQVLRDAALRRALRKRELGVPTYTVAEAAALLSVSQEYLYRLIQTGEFPATYMGKHDQRRKRVVVAQTVEDILARTTTDVALETPGGVA